MTTTLKNSLISLIIMVAGTICFASITYCAFFPLTPKILPEHNVKFSKLITIYNAAGEVIKTYESAGLVTQGPTLVFIDKETNKEVYLKPISYSIIDK